ncbi:MAG TPA: cell division protein FtsZ [Candidatus Binatia bacterium]|nr:cell division protein FtsZ [Candidatus Binatia bacterium]
MQPTTAGDDAFLKSFIRSNDVSIRVVGCGGAGKNTLTTLHNLGLPGIDLIGMNTDAQDLLRTPSDYKVILGKQLTKGQGAGNDPEVGAKAAVESILDIKRAVEGTDLLFVTGGLGGGTGTGSIPIVAAEAKKLGILTVAVVTLPFLMEGQRRWDNAMKGLANLETNVDAVVLIPNEKLMVNCQDLPLHLAFQTADSVLANAIKGIVELITKPGLVNLDFADLTAIIKNSGVALIGTGESDTELRSLEAVEMALRNPLLDANLQGATGALINIVGGKDFTLDEAQKIVTRVNDALNENSKVIWGAQVDDSLDKKLRVLVVVTGLKAKSIVDSHADAQGFVEFDELV